MQLECGTRRCDTIIWPHNVIIFFSGAFRYTLFGIKAQFIIRKEEPKVLACRASYDKKTLARQVIPLAPGYRTALLSRPAHATCPISLFNTKTETSNSVSKRYIIPLTNRVRGLYRKLWTELFPLRFMAQV